MSLWGNLDAQNNAPKQTDTTGYGGNTPQVTANGQVYYANTQVGAFIEKAAIGVFGVDAAEQANTTSATGVPQHAGWVIRKVGTGPVEVITANTGAYSPDGNVYITFTGGGTSNTTANAQIVTNGAKLITGITINSGGSYTSTPTATAANANATFTITMGGRANRVQTETVVAMGSMTGDNETVF